jgi:hypothetical protein
VLFPPAIRGPILTALSSSSVTTTGNPGEKNIWEGQMDPVEDAELGASTSGGSDTAHYAAPTAPTSTPSSTPTSRASTRRSSSRS